jgi:hypothetical protein
LLSCFRAFSLEPFFTAAESIMRVIISIVIFFEFAASDARAQLLRGQAMEGRMAVSRSKQFARHLTINLDVSIAGR